MDLERELRKSKDGWEFEVYQLIKEIPRGCVITYGGLAKRTNARFGRHISPRNVAKLRRKLYGLLTHDTDIPLHRIAKKGDSKSEYDHPQTQVYNRRLREAEGSWPEPTWLYE